MPDDSTPSEAGSNYDRLVDRTGEGLANPWGESAYQRVFAWPATERLLPDCSGRRVLLAGCGRGDHVPWFLDRGAAVVGIDASQAAVRQARAEHGQATFYHGRLRSAADRLAAPIDLVVSQLVFSHVDRWKPALRALRSVTRDDGQLVVTTIHPAHLRADRELDRFDQVDRAVSDWDGPELPTYYRPLSTALEAFLQTGWAIEAVREPTPPEAFRAVAPDRHEAALRRPELLCVRVRAE